jgi:predicted DNA-binding transcriptional regulator YafY
MDRTERFYRIEQLLRDSAAAVPRETFLDRLEVSLATFKRDLEYLRDRFGIPILWDAEARGYRIDPSDPRTQANSLPRPWFNAAEVHALLTMQHLLEHLQPGLLGPHLEPLGERIEMLLEGSDHSSREVRKRIRILNMYTRPVTPEHFGQLSRAVLSGKRLRITHYSRQRDEETEREVSPQRLVYYRDNWYLDTWCHLRKGVRSFGVEAIRQVQPLDKPRKEVPQKQLDQVLGAGYGIFAGAKTQTARLRFTPTRARWVASEAWHPKQVGRFLEDGSYLLEVPYSEDHELVMDILRHGPEVQVLAPAALRTRVREALARTLEQYD